MIELQKNDYSIFDSLDTAMNNVKKKRYISNIKNFMNAVSQIYKTNNDECRFDTCDDVIIEFLIDLGVIGEKNQLANLKKIIGNDYLQLINTIRTILQNDIQNENEIKKYMDKYRKKEVEKYLSDHNSPTVVDFFCGAGGLSLGFRQNGFKILLANDIEEVCTETYAFNHPEIPSSRIITGDIKNIVDSVDKFIIEPVDIIVGGPPCQGFSMANRQRVIDDERNILYKYYVKGVEKLKPKMFVMENVKGMLSVAEQVREDFHNLQTVDYDVSYCILNASDFGVPQNRERLIYIGLRKDISEKINKTPQIIMEEIIEYGKSIKNFNLGDAIFDLRELKALSVQNATELDSFESGRKIDYNPLEGLTEYQELINHNERCSLVYNHKARFNNQRDIEIFHRMLPGDRSDSERIADIMPYSSRSHIFKDKYYKLIANQKCKTITAHMKFDCNMYVHPSQGRGLTPREAARVQSYPDNYFFLGPYTKTYMQIGNSVPPLLSNGIATVLKKYI